MAATTGQIEPLSGATDGEPIGIIDTTSSGETIHTVGATADGTKYEQVSIWAYNYSASAVDLTLELGKTTQPLKVSIPAAGDGPILVLPPMLLENGVVIAAFAGTTDVIAVFGEVIIVSQDAP